MVGFPKVLQTGQDILNCFEMVNNGEYSPVCLKQEIERIERTNSLHVPVNKKEGRNATVNYCYEATVGLTLEDGLKITAVDHIKDKDDTPTETVITFNKNVPTGITILKIPLTVNVFTEMGIDENQLQEIKEALTNVE